MKRRIKKGWWDKLKLQMCGKNGGMGGKKGGGINLDKLSVALLSYAKKPECGIPHINLI